MPISTPDDFRRIATEQRDRKAQEITLPSGLVVMAYQPSPEWWIREVGRLPQSMAARVIGIPVNGDGMTAETLIEFAKWSSRILETVVIKPKIRLEPKSDDEVAANIITDDDLKFLIRFAGGEVTATGRDLDQFPGRRRSTNEPDPGGGSVARAAVDHP